MFSIINIAYYAWVSLSLKIENKPSNCQAYVNTYLRKVVPYYKRKRRKMMKKKNKIKNKKNEEANGCDHSH